MWRNLRQQLARVDTCDFESKTVNNINIKSAHNVVDVLNYVDDTTCFVINPLNPKEPKLLEDDLWNDYLTLAEFKMHDEEMTRSKQRHYLDVPTLEYEKLVQLVGTDDYLSVNTRGFINTSGFNSNGNDQSFDNHIKKCYRQLRKHRTQRSNRI